MLYAKHSQYRFVIFENVFAYEVCRFFRPFDVVLFPNTVQEVTLGTDGRTLLVAAAC